MKTAEQYLPAYGKEWTLVVRAWTIGFIELVHAMAAKGFHGGSIPETALINGAWSAEPSCSPLYTPGQEKNSPGVPGLRTPLQGITRTGQQV